MKVIVQADVLIATLLGEQQINAEQQYRKNTFCLLTEVDGNSVAYNVLSGEMVELTLEETAFLQKEDSAYTEALSELIKKWFLVPVEHDDMKLSDEIKEFAKLFNKQDGISSYTIFTTTDCNARCFYCFELGQKRIPMSAQVAKDTVSFIIKNAPAKKKVDLRWFGGEPLYNAEAIDIITQGLEEAGITFASSMTSNGYLFDDSTVQKAVEKWKLSTVQITLDGMEETYNRIKAYIYINDKSAFAVVTDNIERLLKKGVYVMVRLNLSEQNKEELYELIDWLRSRFDGQKRFSIYVHQLFDHEADQQNVPERIKLAEEVIKMEEYILQNSVLSEKALHKGMQKNHCMADNPGAIAIMPDGILGKCEHFSEEDYVGTIYEGITRPEKIAEFSARENNMVMCAGCLAYPVCIRLKKCPDVSHGYCDIKTRITTEAKLAHKVKYIYRQITNKQKEGSA